MDTKPCLVIGMVCAAWAGLAAGQAAPRSVVLVSNAAGRLSAPGSTSDLPGAQRYFTDYAGHAVRRSALDGSNVTTVVEGVSTPYGLAFDPEAQQLLWTSSADETVQAVLPDGTGGVVLPSAFDENYVLVQRGETLDTAFLVEGGELLRLTIDRQTGAEQRHVLAWLSPDSVHGLALSPLGDVLYLGDANGMMTQRLRLSDLTLSTLIYTDEPPLPDPLPDPDPWPWPIPDPALFSPEGVR